MELRYLGRVSLWFGLLSTALCQVDYEKCHLLLKTPEARSHVNHGDNLTYQFNIALNISTDTDSMAVLVNGSNLQVLDTSDLLGTNFTWRNSEGLIAEMNSPSFGVEVVQESGLQPVSEIDLQIPLTFGDLQLQRVSGEIELHVADAAPLGSIIRPIMYILLFLEQKTVYQTTVLGDYVFIEIPEMEVLAAEQRGLEMKETATIMAYLRIPNMSLRQSLLNVYIPKHESTDDVADDFNTNEPYMTVTDFQAVTYTGLSEKSSQRIAEISPVFLSGSRTSEFDGIAFTIPELYDNDTASRNISYELGFQTVVKSLDFSGSYEGMELKVAYVLETGNIFFIIRNNTLFVKRSFDVERVPKLHFALELMDTQTESDGVVAYYQLNVCHAQNVSWSSAYNVSILMYLPPFLRDFEMLRTKDAVRTKSQVGNILHEYLIEFKLARVSFIHNVRLQFRVILKTSHRLYQPGEKFTIFVEGLYYSNLRDTEYIRDIAGFPYIFNVTKVKGDAITMPLCQCLDDKFAQCRCSTKNACDKKPGNVTCVECSVPWHCVKTLESFGRACSLKCGGTIAYFCDSTKRKRNTRDIVTCSKQFNNGSVERLSPVVGTILGCDRRGDRLYGISQNGLAYVISDDEGTTWYNIPSQMYARALKTATFEASVFV